MTPAALAALGPSAPAAGRTSGRPCPCALWRAERVQTNQFLSTATVDCEGLPLPVLFGAAIALGKAPDASRGMRAAKRLANAWRGRLGLSRTNDAAGDKSLAVGQMFFNGRLGCGGASIRFLSSPGLGLPLPPLPGLGAFTPV